MLDEIQEQVTGHRDGILVVEAGPGSGKTRVVVERTRKLINSGVNPEEILVITFTTEAAGEIKKRLPGYKCWVSTIHSLGYAILKEVLGAALPSLVDDVEAKEMFLRYCQEGGVLASEEDYLAVTNCKSLLIPAKGDAPTAYKEYVRRMSKENRMDLQDLVMLPCMLLKGKTLKKWASRWRYVTVDEAHDCTPAEARLASLLAHGNLCLVEDENQSLYGWRYGSPRNLPKGLPYQLPYTYRCPQNIYDKAWSLIENHTSQERLKCQNTDGEFSLRVGTPSQIIPNAVKGITDSMVLCRTQEEVSDIEELLKGSGIPANRLPTVFDSEEADVVRAFVSAALGRPSGWKAAAAFSRFPLGDRAARAAVQAKNPSGLKEFITMGLAQEPGERYNTILKEFTGTLQDYLSLLWARRTPEDNVRVMTLHGSKGLEADNVVVANLNRGTIPHKKEKSLDAERRLLYVGMTRSRKKLTLQCDPTRDRSPFVRELL